MAEEKKKTVNVNTTKSIKAATVSTSALDKQMKDAAKILGEEKKAEVTIPSYLKGRLGNTVPVAINGAVIHVPVGKKVKIPESMAAVLNNMLENLKL